MGTEARSAFIAQNHTCGSRREGVDSWRALMATAFTHHPGVVVVSKVHGNPQVASMEQALCLFTAAYNQRVRYDIVIFSSQPLMQTEIKDLQALAAPARLS